MVEGKWVIMYLSVGLEAQDQVAMTINMEQKIIVH